MFIIEFVKLLALYRCVMMIWVLCWMSSICPSSWSLYIYHAVAPGTWFIWIHKWAFLPPGFWLGSVEGWDSVSRSGKGRRRERFPYCLHFFTVGYPQPGCILLLQVTAPLSSFCLRVCWPLPFLYPSRLVGGVKPCCYPPWDTALSLVISSQPACAL